MVIFSNSGLPCQNVFPSSSNLIQKILYSMRLLPGVNHNFADLSIAFQYCSVPPNRSIIQGFISKVIARILGCLLPFGGYRKPGCSFRYLWTKTSISVITIMMLDVSHEPRIALERGARSKPAYAGDFEVIVISHFNNCQNLTLYSAAPAKTAIPLQLSVRNLSMF